MIRPMLQQTDSAELGEPLALAHRTLIDAALEAMGRGLSEHLFANLYLFRTVHRYRYHAAPIPHITGVTYDGVTHCMPLLECDAPLAMSFAQRFGCVYPLAAPPEGALALGGVVSDNLDDADYVYDAARMAGLAGHALKDKRRQASVFSTTHRPHVRPLDSSNVGMAQQVLNLWLSQVQEIRTQTDFDACREALDMQDALGLQGLLLLCGADAPCGFLLFSLLGDETAVVHFAKADRTLVGAYPYLFSRLAALRGIRWLNFEQDLGKPGLRQAKRALDPIGQRRKYRLCAAGANPAKV